MLSHDFEVTVLESRNPMYAGTDYIEFEITEEEAELIRKAIEEDVAMAEVPELHDLHERIRAAYREQLEDEVRDNGVFDDEYPDDYDEDDEDSEETLEEYRDELVREFAENAEFEIQF